MYSAGSIVEWIVGSRASRIESFIDRMKMTIIHGEFSREIFKEIGNYEGNYETANITANFTANCKNLNITAV